MYNTSACIYILQSNAEDSSASHDGKRAGEGGSPVLKAADENHFQVVTLKTVGVIV